MVLSAQNSLGPGREWTEPIESQGNFREKTCSKHLWKVSKSKSRGFWQIYHKYFIKFSFILDGSEDATDHHLLCNLTGSVNFASKTGVRTLSHVAKALLI